MELADSAANYILKKDIIKMTLTSIFAPIYNAISMIMRQKNQLLPGLVQIPPNIINGILLSILVIMNWQNN